MDYRVEMFEFPEGKPPARYKRLFGTYPSVAEAVRDGKHEVTTSALHRNPIGFRVFDKDGHEVLEWRLGDQP